MEHSSLRDGEFSLTSSHDLVPLSDPDDGKAIAVGETLLANIDTPADHDYFFMELEADETVFITVDSMIIDPLVLAGPGNASIRSFERDDDGGGGLLGLNPRLVYTAASAGQHVILITDSPHTRSGGYLVTVSAE